ncbi:MAG: hypothetical protein M3250_07800 [Thermoproteota archaeon]|nr:hypothetical protein [Thermoproteota archaeon]
MIDTKTTATKDEENDMTIETKQKEEESSKRMSTSLNVDPDLYKEFKIEALRRDMEISDLLDYAMKLVLNEQKEKKEE